MKQYQLNDNILILKVKKASFFGRIIVFLVAFVSFIFPTIATINAIISKEFHIAYIIAILVFWVIGFYMLRIALWNTYGREIITFKNGSVEYQPDYGWFKDDKKIFTMPNHHFDFKQTPSSNNGNAVLVIGKYDSVIECVTQLQKDEIMQLID